MPKKLQINAIPQGKVKLNLTYDGAGCCFAQGLSPGWGLQLAAGPGSPVAGLGAVNACGERRPGSTWSPGGQTLGWVRDFHQFSLKKSPCPSSKHPTPRRVTTAHPHPALLLWAVIREGAKKAVGGDGHLLPRLAASGGAGLQGGRVPCPPAQHGGQEQALEPARGQVPLPLSEGSDGASVTHREQRGDATGAGDRGEVVPSRSFQAGKWSHRMSVQPVRTPRLPKEVTVSSQEHAGRSLSQNIVLFRKLAPRQQSRMLIWE